MRKVKYLGLSIVLMSFCICNIGVHAAKKPYEIERESKKDRKSDVAIIELDEKSNIVQEGDYSLSHLYSDILTDASVADGWFYYYSEGTESPVSWMEWQCLDEMYTSCEIMFDLQNLNPKQSKTFTERFDGFIIYKMDLNKIPSCNSATAYMHMIRDNAKEQEDAEIFELTPLQRNPGQLDTDGYEVRSKDAVLLEKNEIAQQDLIADVSESFYRSWEDSEGQEPMWAVFSYDDQTVYIVNLREHLVEY